jgi:hypothetical protein
MIIILEGPDGAGKSTLGHSLSNHIRNMGYHHEGLPPKSGSLLEHYGALLQAARQSVGGVVFDRLALGERVYGPIMRNEDRLGLDGWRIFQRLIAASGAYQILCRPSYETCLKNWSSGRPEYISRVAQFKDVYVRYTELNVPDIIVYDYEHDSFTLLLDQLRVPRKILPSSMIGSPNATYLFVGERGSGTIDPTQTEENRQHARILPFFGLANSSGYLNHAIQLAGFEEKDIAFINAFTLDGRMTNMIPAFPKVIALGREAGAVCDDQGVDHQQVPHPQFWARFKHNDMLGYVSLLKNCQVTSVSQG